MDRLGSYGWEGFVGMLGRDVTPAVVAAVRLVDVAQTSTVEREQPSVACGTVAEGVEAMEPGSVVVVAEGEMHTD